MANNQQNLRPEEQATLFALLKKAGQQPVSGGIAPEALPEVQPQEGDRMNPNDAIQQILAAKASGPQLRAGANGQLVERVPVDQPLLRLFGMKKDQPVNNPNYLDTVKAAGLSEFLPSGLAQTPDGQPFVGPKAFQTTLSAAQSFGPKSRASFYSYLGNDPDTQMPVTFNSADNTFYRGGSPVPAGELGRLLSKVKPQLEGAQVNEITNLLNAQSQLQEVKSLFAKDAVGPVQARLYNASKMMGVNLPDLRGLASITDDKARLRTVLASGINDYIKAITGAQMSEVEARRIMSAMPSADAAEEAFMPMLEQVLKIADTKLTNRLDVLETQGTVGVKELRGLSKRGTPSTAKKEKSALDLSTVDGVKAAYKSGNLDVNQAKALIKSLTKGGL